MEASNSQVKKSERRTIVGVIKALPGKGTAVVEIEEIKQHPKYQKRYKHTRRFHASIGKATPTIGQKVTIVEAKPSSSSKRWRIMQKV